MNILQSKLTDPPTFARHGTIPLPYCASASHEHHLGLILRDFNFRWKMPNSYSYRSFDFRCVAL